MSTGQPVIEDAAANPVPCFEHREGVVPCPVEVAGRGQACEPRTHDDHVENFRVTLGDRIGRTGGGYRNRS